MRRLEKFRIDNKGQVDLLNQNELLNVNGAIASSESSLKCGSFETTCDNNCADMEWVTVEDGVVISRIRKDTLNDCP